MLLYSHISASVITKPCVVFLLYRKEIHSLYQRQLRGLLPSCLSDVISASLPVVKRWGQAHRCALGGVSAYSLLYLDLLPARCLHCSLLYCHYQRLFSLAAVS